MNIQKIILIAILILSLFFKFLFLNVFPDGLNFVEATAGLRAQNLLESGRDEYGRVFPVLFSNWSDFEMPLPTYLITPFVAIDRTDPVFIRLPFVFVGTLIILVVYLLTKKLFPDSRKIPFLTALVVAVSPWNIWLSVLYSPELLGLLFFLAGVFFYFCYGVKPKQSWLLFLSPVFFILALFSSKQLLIFLVLFPLYLYLSRRDFRPLGVFAFGISLLFLILFTNQIELANFFSYDLSLFKNESIVQSVNVMRGQDMINGIQPLVSSLFYNKSYFVLLVLNNFISILNPALIFAYGDGISFNSPSNFGPLLVSFLPFLIFGLKKMYQEKPVVLKLLLSWIVIAVLNNIFLQNSYDIRRLLPLFIPLSVIAAFAVAKLSGRWLAVLLVIVSFNTGVIFYDAVAKESNRAEKSWNPSTIETALYIRENKGKGLRSSLTGQTIQTIWLTDGLDPNPGPVLGYYLEVPYSKLNLSENNGRLTKGWISKVDSIQIGNIDSLKNLADFDLVIISNDQKELFKCPSIRDEIQSLDKKYLLIERCYEKE